MSQSNQDELILYILMRQDLDSMNPGKAMAQAAHAANQFQAIAPLKGEYWLDKYDEWCEDRRFGTTIVLGTNGAGLTHWLKKIEGKDGIWDVVYDPTYPVRDGQVTHLIPLNTCSWVFGYRNDLEPYLSYLELHP